MRSAAQRAVVDHRTAAAAPATAADTTHRNPASVSASASASAAPRDRLDPRQGEPLAQLLSVFREAPVRPEALRLSLVAEIHMFLALLLPLLLLWMVMDLLLGLELALLCLLGVFTRVVALIY